MKKNETTVQGCPYDAQTESLCLDINLSESEKRRAQIHLQQCSHCRKKFQELEGLYHCINNEMQKPITNKVLDLAKEIRSKDTKYGLVVCNPIKKGKGKETFAFKTKVLFTANGTGAIRNKKLADFDLNSLPQETVAIRAMTDKSCDKMLLYLWRAGGETFEGWELKVGDNTYRATIKEGGTSFIPFMEIEDLGDKVIYFKEKHKESASENRFKYLMNAVYK
ncbi:hypothetical protein EH223_19960 [candidate division KSB1 bacterium]|nr:hypothetical protein [candidate division KSB1 bacterium]RQW00215.1 MAG: hypothetical protein EH223_19960 [candidate division KSB1 bacterium]